MNTSKLCRVRKFFCVLMVALIATMSFSLVACAPSDEEVIRTGLTTELDEIKNPSDATISLTVAAMGNTSSFTELGVVPEDFIRAWLTGFDYEIGAITVEGNSATVELKIIVKSMTGITTDWMTRITELQADPAFYSMSVSDRMARAGEMLYECIDAAPLQELNTTITCPKTGNAWGITTALNAAVEQAMTA